MGIRRSLADTSNNDELQKYLDEKAYDTASLGETSADEIIQQASSSSGGVDIYRESSLSRSYNKAGELAAAVEDYETSIV